MPEPNTHVPHHTQRENDTTNGGGAEGAAPIGTIARPLCVWCECWRCFESIKSIESIESVESSDSIESIESTQSIEPIESIEF